ncbi:MAG: hypothetical protein IPP56_08805 [Bacteroidetes bacterium]|nr:hypothetical protein [Bacteroidota bacterium]MBK9672520.1 hypothetical protein [Bacteroidota bacterium]MBK9799809.1 hypothetical protein [Bacteroidota bacterium]MBP6412909.1 hypothetical protein [Bacteroidia bacterium]
MRKIILIGPFILLIAGAVFVLFKINHKTFNIASQKPDYVMSAARLFNEFELVEATANAKYEDKIIEVVGSVREVKQTMDNEIIVLLASGNTMFSVRCKLATSEKLVAMDIQENEEIAIRGICKGMLLDVLLEECIID